MNPEKELPYRITWLSMRDGEMLRASVSGCDNTLETLLAYSYWYEIAAEVRDARPAQLLVVSEIAGPPPSPEQLARFVESLDGLGLEGVRMAYVTSHSENIPGVEVGEILAREHGFNVRVFANETQAVLWLRHGEE